MRRILALSAALLLAPALCRGAYAQAINPATLSETDVSVIEVAQAAQSGKTFAAMTIIDAPPHKLCAIVQDYGAYGRYMPNTRSAELVSGLPPGSPQGAPPGSVLVDMTLDLPLGKVKRYRLRLDAKTSASSCQLSWKLVPREDLKTDDTIADTSGYWMFSPLPANSGKSVAEYFVYADPGPVPFGLGWIVDIMSRKSLPRTLEALRGEALRRAAP
jgi:hypothetical protein